MKEIIIDPSLDERHKEEYYFGRMYCSNCDRPNGLYDGPVDAMIPYGQPVPKEKKYYCPNCKCLTLMF